MKKLTAYMADYKKECVLAPLFKLLEAVFELFVPLVIARMIDSGIPSGSNRTVVLYCGLLVILGIVGLVCSVSAQYFAAKAAVGYGCQVRRSLFRHINTLSFSAVDQFGSSTLINRMTGDINQMQSGINLTLRLLLRSPVIVFGAMIMAFTIDVRASLIFVAVIPLLSLIVFGIMAAGMPLYKKVQTNLDRVTAATRENLAGVRVIRAFCRESKEISDYKDKNQVLAKAQITAARVAALMNPLTYVLINLAILLLLRTGAVRVNSGLLTTGQVVALYNYLAQILVELIKMANVIININKSLACAKRIRAVLNTAPGMKNGTQTPGGVGRVVFDHVTFCYEGNSRPSLTDISFTADPGQTIGIIGGTGSGKSTLVQLIGRFYDATDGAVLLGGTNVKGYDLTALRKAIAYVPQKAVLFKGTIRDNLSFGGNRDEAVLLSSLHAAQADDILKSRPEGLDAPVEAGGRNFSGGQRQRLTIARALVRRSDVLILDDSSSALDFATDAALRRSLAALDWNPTIFVVSQRTGTIAHADRILVLDNGVLVGNDTHENLLENCPVYREIHESQHKKEPSGGTTA